jgi:hypothetical protein
MRAVLIIHPSWIYNPLIRRGWQHDGRSAYNPADTPVMPQKIPG